MEGYPTEDVYDYGNYGDLTEEQIEQLGDLQGVQEQQIQALLNQQLGTEGGRRAVIVDQNQLEQILE